MGDKSTLYIYKVIDWNQSTGTVTKKRTVFFDKERLVSSSYWSEEYILTSWLKCDACFSLITLSIFLLQV